MSTSGSTNYNLTRDEIITTALERLGKLGAGATVDSDDVTLLNKLLNVMVKGWQAKGIHVWTTEEGAIFLTENQYIYTLSSSTTDKAGKNPVQTLLDGDATGSSLTVWSTIGMTAGDNIGICLDDNTIQWTTIVSVDDLTSVTITASLTGAASDTNSVYTYTTAVGRPLTIKSARFVTSAGIERPLDVMGRTRFMNLPDKSTVGKVNSLHYNPKVSTGLLYLWPLPDDVNEHVRFTYVRSIEDFDASGDNPDFPQEWMDCLIANLAVKAGSAFGIDVNKSFPDLVAEAREALFDMMTWDMEEGSVRIVPNERFDY